MRLDKGAESMMGPQPKRVSPCAPNHSIVTATSNLNSVGTTNTSSGIQFLCRSTKVLLCSMEIFAAYFSARLARRPFTRSTDTND